jgi:hypothetical protein
VPARHDSSEVPVAGESVPPRPPVDIADETYVRAAPSVVARVVGDPGSWIRWWPDLVPRVTRDRGVKGRQWAVTGGVRGSMEVWLEPVGPGTVVHWYLRAVPPGRRSPRRLRRLAERRRRAWKRSMFELKDRLEAFKDAPDPAESR